MLSQCCGKLRFFYIYNYTGALTINSRYHERLPCTFHPPPLLLPLFAVFTFHIRKCIWHKPLVIVYCVCQTVSTKGGTAKRGRDHLQSEEFCYLHIYHVVVKPRALTQCHYWYLQI